MKHPGRECRPDPPRGHAQKNPDTGETVAVKVVDRNVERLPKQLHSFRREVEIMNGLRHSNIIRLRALVSEPTVHLLVLEIADGGELFDSVSGWVVIIRSRCAVSRRWGRRLLMI